MWNSFMYENLKTTVERAWNDRELLRDEAVKSAIRETPTEVKKVKVITLSGV